MSIEQEFPKPRRKVVKLFDMSLSHTNCSGTGVIRGALSCRGQGTHYLPFRGGNIYQLGVVEDDARQGSNKAGGEPMVALPASRDAYG